jgi:hypothetical protein
MLACLLAAAPGPGQVDIPAAVEAIFHSVDVDRDNCLSRREWRANARASLSRRAHSRLELDRMVASVTDAYRQLDLNRDGCLTRREYRTAAARNMARWFAEEP